MHDRQHGLESDFLGCFVRAGGEGSWQAEGASVFDGKVELTKVGTPIGWAAAGDRFGCDWGDAVACAVGALAGGDAVGGDEGVDGGGVGW